MRYNDERASPNASFHSQGRVISHLDQRVSNELVDAVIDNRLTRIKTFRDNWRTLSTCVRFHDDLFMVKIPRARNGRMWERLLTLFRESDALRCFRHIELMAKLGFYAPEPVLGWEHRQKGVVVNSFVCYRFVAGRGAQPADAERVLAELRAFHRRGYLRGDAQLANFLIADGKVTFIDFRLKKPFFFRKLRQAGELNRFIRSCPEAQAFVGEQVARSAWFRLASLREEIWFGLRRLKKRVRKALRHRR